MKLLYLTTALHPMDYNALLEKKKNVPNPSNQNFHSKLIAYFKTHYQVQVISRRTTSKQLFVTQSEKDNFFYPGYINLPLLKNLMTISTSVSHAQMSFFDYIVVDVLNLTMMETAIQIKRKTNTPIIGVVTDNPVNLSNVRNFYIQNVFKKAAKCDAFIGLTPSLLNLFNPLHKPTLEIPGFLPLNNLPAKKQEENYAYFGGALYSRYGVDVLLETFRKEQPLPLKIAGHGPLGNELKHGMNGNIEFLSIISPEKALEYSQNSAININPRPYDSALEQYSIPSKLIDYIFTGVPTISTQNAPIMNIVGNNVFWISDVTVYGLTNAIQTILADQEEWQNRALRAKELLIDKLGPSKFSASFTELIKQIKN